MENDLISRQAAIDALMEILDRPNHAEFLYTDEICNTLNELPSAQPELCEDAVSRQRLLSDLKELIAAWEKYPCMAEQIKGVESAIGYVAIIPSVTPKPEQRWIPVSERLPDVAQRVLLSGHGQVMVGMLHSFGKYSLEPTGISYVYPKDDIEAWMPLPEPYRMGETE